MDKDWFMERVGRVVRFTYDYLGDIKSKERTIKDEREAGYMWLMSQKGYKFNDVEHG